MALYLAKKGANVYMVCRNLDRGTKAKDEIVESTKNQNVHLLICDCSLESDVRRLWTEYTTLVPEPKLDGLICNAGLLVHERSVTAEGVEVIAAVHLIFGTYLLGKLAMPYLEASGDGRLLMVSSGGMYNTKFPSFEDFTSMGTAKFDGQFAYAYAKRGQVLLAEAWARAHPRVTVVSCHPGWTLTEGVEAAYGSSKSYLEPLRSLWEGCEGILYLLAAPRAEIKSGEFYLDREPAPKHLSGMLWGENSLTQNTAGEVQDMLAQLEAWSSAATRPPAAELARQRAARLPLVAAARPMDLQAFMGRWHVLANIPTPFEVGTTDCVETYEWQPEHQRIKVVFKYLNPGSTVENVMYQRATVSNAPVNTEWAISPKLGGVYIPLGLTYLVADLDEDGQCVLVGVPDRAYLWIMTRARPPPVQGAPGAPKEGVTYMDQAEADRVFERAVRRAEELGYDRAKVLRVPFTGY